MRKRRTLPARHRSEPVPAARAIGARIRDLRKSTGHTFDSLVEEARIGRGSLSELERGLLVPTALMLEKVAGALGVTVADLVLGESPREHLFAIARELGEAEVRELVSVAERMRSARRRSR